MTAMLPDLKLVYVMRQPIDRLVSHYIHEWSERTIFGSLEVAVRRFPRLIDYSRYSMQLQPYLDAYGCRNILPVFLERLTLEPQLEFERICRFVGYHGEPQWNVRLAKQNVSNERLRKSVVRDAIVWNPAVTWFRRKFVPQAWRESIKDLWRVRERPEVSKRLERHLSAVFDEDLVLLGEWLGTEFTCTNFRDTAAAGPFKFSGRTAGSLM
jgi:hypothetical protein